MISRCFFPVNGQTDEKGTVFVSYVQNIARTGNKCASFVLLLSSIDRLSSFLYDGFIPYHDRFCARHLTAPAFGEILCRHNAAVRTAFESERDTA